VAATAGGSERAALLAAFNSSSKVLEETVGHFLLPCHPISARAELCELSANLGVKLRIFSNAAVAVFFDLTFAPPLAKTAAPALALRPKCDNPSAGRASVSSTSPANLAFTGPTFGRHFCGHPSVTSARFPHNREWDWFEDSGFA